MSKNNFHLVVYTYLPPIRSIHKNEKNKIKTKTNEIGSEHNQSQITAVKINHQHFIDENNSNDNRDQ